MDNQYSTPKSNLTNKTKKSTSGKWISVFAVILAGLYFVWWAYQSNQWNYAIYSIPYLFAGIALIMNKSWSQYIFYIIAIFHIGWWLYKLLSVEEWNYVGLLDLFNKSSPRIIIYDCKYRFSCTDL